MQTLAHSEVFPQRSPAHFSSDLERRLCCDQAQDREKKTWFSQSSGPARSNLEPTVEVVIRDNAPASGRSAAKDVKPVLHTNQPVKEPAWSFDERNDIVCEAARRQN